MGIPLGFNSQCACLKSIYSKKEQVKVTVAARWVIYWMSVDSSCSVLQDEVHVQRLGDTVAYTGAAFGPLIVGWLTDQYVSCLYIHTHMYIHIVCG